MTESIHGHEVIEFIAEHGPFTRATLLAAMAERYGAAARFHSCSAQDMDAAQLVDFLVSKGKFAEEGQAPAGGCTCGH